MNENPVSDTCVRLSFISLWLLSHIKADHYLLVVDPSVHEMASWWLQDCAAILPNKCGGLSPWLHRHGDDRCNILYIGVCPMFLLKSVATKKVRHYWWELSYLSHNDTTTKRMHSVRVEKVVHSGITEIKVMVEWPSLLTTILFQASSRGHIRGPYYYDTADEREEGKKLMLC